MPSAIVPVSNELPTSVKTPASARAIEVSKQRFRRRNDPQPASVRTDGQSGQSIEPSHGVFEGHTL